MTAPTRTAGPRWVLVMIVVATFVMAAVSRSPEAGMAWRIAFVSVSLSLSGFVVWGALRYSWSLRHVLVVAIVMRVLVFPLHPTLSDDGYRYVWDGRLTSQEGIDPYHYRPSDAPLAEFHDEPLYEALNSKDFYSVYPPVSQLVFAAAGTLFPLGWMASWYGLKAIILGFELLGIGVLARHVGPESLALYAWSPLAVVEIAGQGHTEGVMVGALLLVLHALYRHRPLLAGGALAVAGWVKLLPFLLFPVLGRRLGYKGLASGGVIGIVLFLPFLSAYWWPHVRSSLELYSQYFEFNAGVYLLLKAGLLAAFDSDVYKWSVPLLQSVFLLSAVALIYVSHGRKSSSLPTATLIGVVFTLFLLTSTTVHPWYFLGALALVPLIYESSDRLLAWSLLWWSSASLATYLFYTGPSWAYPTAIALGWGGGLFLLLLWMVRKTLPVLMKRRARSKWSWIEQALLGQSLSLILDLGSGEGYVGEAAALATSADVHLADVVDFHAVDLPFVQFDGEKLPFEDQAFDLTLLVFVLHHAAEQEVLLREAGRVTKGPLVILESVYVSTFQHHLLRALDILANRLRSIGAMTSQEEHLHFRTEEDWMDIFASLGYTVSVRSRRGRLLHRQALFVLIQQ